MIAEKRSIQRSITKNEKVAGFVSKLYGLFALLLLAGDTVLGHFIIKKVSCKHISHVS